jgi:aquaporin Z
MHAMKWRQAMAEFIGTAILVMVGPGSAILAGDKIGWHGVSLAFGLALLVMAYAIGHVSGCHINPAVTLAFVATKKMTIQRAVYYWIAQIVGGIFGAAMIAAVANLDDRGGFASNGWADASPSGRGFWPMVIVEVIFTAILIFVVLSTTNAKFPKGFGGIAAGLTLAAIHLVTIPVDNTSVNPARSIATALFANTNLPYLEQLWAFVVFPMLGAVLGVFAWRAVDDSHLDNAAISDV